MATDPRHLELRTTEALERIGKELSLLGNAGALTARGTEVGAIEGR